MRQLFLCCTLLRETPIHGHRKLWPKPLGPFARSVHQRCFLQPPLRAMKTTSLFLASWASFTWSASAKAFMHPSATLYIFSEACTGFGFHRAWCCLMSSPPPLASQPSGPLFIGIHITGLSPLGATPTHSSPFTFLSGSSLWGNPASRGILGICLPMPASACLARTHI